MGFKEKFKDIAGKVTTTVDKGIKDASDGVQKITEKNRLNKEINQLNNEINDIFLNVGKELYKNSPDSETFSAEFISIKEKQAKVDGLKKQVNLLDGMLICDSCGEAIPQDSKVCNKCGAEVKQPEPVVEQEVVEVEAETVNFCSVCGEKLQDGAAFCSKCGAKID